MHELRWAVEPIRSLKLAVIETWHMLLNYELKLQLLLGRGVMSRASLTEARL